jgi:uncharacterized protein
MDMQRLTEIKNELEFYLEKMENGYRTEATDHIYGVSQLCALIAIRRGADVEISRACGLLHDIWTINTGNSANHAHHGAGLAKSVLEGIRLFDAYEINIIVEAIRNHTNKGEEHDIYSEILKDADVLQRYLTDSNQKFSKSKAQRIKNTMRELGLNIKVNKK